MSVCDGVSSFEADVALGIDLRSIHLGLLPNPVFLSEGKKSVSGELSNHVEKLEDQVVRDGFVISTGSVGLPVFFPTVEDTEVVVLHVPGILLETLVNPIGDKGNGLHEDDDERADHPAVKLDCGAPPEGLHH